MRLPQTKILILLAVLAMVAGIIAWKMGLVEWALSMKEPVLAWCRSHPVALFAAIAKAPLSPPFHLADGKALRTLHRHAV